MNTSMMAVLVALAAALCLQEKPKVFEGPPTQLIPTGLAVDAKGTMLAAAYSEGPEFIKLWSFDRDDAPKALPGVKNGVNGMALSPDGKILACGLNGGRIALLEVPSGRKLAEFGEDLLVYPRLRFSGNGTLLIGANKTSTVDVFDVKTRKRLHEIKGRQGPEAAVSPDGKLLAFAAWEAKAGLDKMQLWDPTAGKQVRTLDQAPRAVQSIAFSPDGKLLAATGIDPRAQGAIVYIIQVWDLDTGGVKTTLKGPDRPIHVVRFAQGGKLLAAATDLGKIHLWPCETWTEIPGGGGGECPGSRMEVVGDRRLATAYRNKLFVWTPPDAPK